MPYRHQGLVRGDIPRGSFLGTIGHVLGGAVGGFIKGGPIGAITGAIGGTIDATRDNMNAAQPIGSTPPPPIAPVMVNGRPTAGNMSADDLVRMHQLNVHKAQAKALATKTTALAQAGRMTGGGSGKRRHMRVTNPRALRRAIRRAEGFAKLAMKTIRIIHPRKQGRFGGFKKAKRR